MRVYFMKLQRVETMSLSCCQTSPLAKCVLSFNSSRKTDRLLIVESIDEAKGHFLRNITFIT